MTGELAAGTVYLITDISGSLDFNGTVQAITGIIAPGGYSSNNTPSSEHPVTTSPAACVIMSKEMLSDHARRWGVEWR
jgi:hypothetical protein